ncbi:MAG: protein phosphatase [Deltaproteobacteria bacterium CG11_big_fil_rev_8_21_14_0_20_47_16]|nr:MAG: protein phosphatase [Deltaproteobacteria bacterium CG11_big_fil_rev_8_21_14_0_20_47_16]
MQMNAVGLSDVGRKREKNEDSFIVDEKLGLAVVADGMGGHSGGEFASKIAIETVTEVLHKLAIDPDMTLHGKTTLRPHDHGGKLNYAIQEAGRRIFDRACKEPELKGMGTTTVALLVAEGRVYLGNVGDSRGYLLRNGVFRQLTQDHSFVGEQVRAGVISAETAKTHRMRNVITRSVGFQSEVDSDILQKTAKDGDIFLLCSDGLSNMVEDAEMKVILESSPPADACRKLIDIANAHGGDDNITVVLVSFKETNSGKALQDEDMAEETTIEI